jgi:hypothetical protein
MEKSSQRILRNNLLVVLAAALVLGALAGLTDSSSITLFAALCGAQVVVNLLLGLAYIGKKATTGRSPAPYFLSALLVLIIGFGICSSPAFSNLGRVN